MFWHDSIYKKEEVYLCDQFVADIDVKKYKYDFDFERESEETVKEVLKNQIE